MQDLFKNKQCAVFYISYYYINVIGDGSDAGGTGGLAAVVRVITAVVAEQEAGRMISSR